MSSSAEGVRLKTQPASVRLRPEAGEAAVAAFFQEQLDRARSEAFEAGRAAAVEELGGVLDEAVQTLEREGVRHLEELAQASVQIGLAVTRELLKIEVVAGGHDIESAVRATLAQLRSGRDTCKVVLHPEDHARLEEVPFGSSVEIVADTGVRRGDVVVESVQGRLVRSLDDAMESIASALRSELAP